MLVKYHVKGDRVKRIRNVFSISINYVGDLMVHYEKDGKKHTQHLMRTASFSSLTIVDEEKQNEYKTT